MMPNRRTILLITIICYFSISNGNENGMVNISNKTNTTNKNVDNSGQQDVKGFIVTDKTHQIIAKTKELDSDEASVEEVEEENEIQTINESNDDNIEKEKVRAEIIKKEKHAISLYERALLLLNNSKLNSMKAYSLLQESAKLNHQKSKVLVAKSHLFGDNLPLNIEIAKKYFSSLPLNESSVFLGFMHSIGLGFDASQPKASLYYTFSASNGNPLAQMALAFRYKFGISEITSCELALDFYHKVATNVVEQVSISGGSIVRDIRLTEEKENKESLYETLDTDLIQYYQFLAKRGDVGAQVGLGQLYYNGGHGVIRDQRRALNYFRKAAEAGNENSLAFLGKIHLEGSHAVQQNNEIALQYFERSTEKGNPVGQSGLGLMYLYGKGVDSDYHKAYHYFSLSARQGWVDGQLQLGLMYMNGLGVSRDYRMAIRYFSMASQSNHVLALFNLAQLHASGSGTVRSCSSAVEMFKKVAERGHWSSLFMEAYNDYKLGKITQAFIKYAFLSELGYESAQSNAAFILENHEIKELFNKNESLSLALMYWTRSASQGNSYARLKVGDYHYYGYGTKIDYKMALNYYRRASEFRFNSQALFNLGLMHESGLGVKRDLRLAQLYYDMSAQISSEAALPVALATIKLKIVYGLQLIMQYFFGISQWFGPNWDLYLMTLLIIILVFVIYVKYRLA